CSRLAQWARNRASRVAKTAPLRCAWLATRAVRLAYARPGYRVPRPQALGRKRADKRERWAALERYGLPDALPTSSAGIAVAGIQAQARLIEKVKPARIILLGYGFDKVLALRHHAGRVTLAGVQAFFAASRAPSAPARLGSTRPGWHRVRPCRPPATLVQAASRIFVGLASGECTSSHPPAAIATPSAGIIYKYWVHSRSGINHYATATLAGIASVA
nr:hypothetical protein [Tanacetum cinerariifolium]